MVSIGAYSETRAGSGNRGNTHGLEGHGQQGDGFLLAGGHENVHFAGVRRLGEGGGPGNQFIGNPRPSGHDDHHLVALLPSPLYSSRHFLDVVDVRHRGAAEFLYEETHWE